MSNKFWISEAAFFSFSVIMEIVLKKWRQVPSQNFIEIYGNKEGDS